MTRQQAMTPAALAAVLADEARRHGLSLVDVAAEVALLATPDEVPEPTSKHDTVPPWSYACKELDDTVNCREVSTYASTPAEAALVVAVGAAILRRGDR